MTKDLNALIERLEAWAPLIASGYECPAASTAMLEAAQALRDLQPVRDEAVVERAFLAVMNAPDRELSLPLTAWAERNLLKRRIAVAIRALQGDV